jgi:hypothetical protein
MRTGVKTPLTILVALTFLAGCKSKPPKAGYLRVDDGHGVQFIQWTQEGRQLKGTVELLERTPDNEIITALAVCDGVLDGENFSMISKSVRTSHGGNEKTGEKVTGRLKGDTLTLFRDEDRSEPKELRRATPAEFGEASRNL